MGKFSENAFFEDFTENPKIYPKIKIFVKIPGFSHFRGEGKNTRKKVKKRVFRAFPDILLYPTNPLVKPD